VKFTSADALEWEHVAALVKRYIATAAGDAELAKVQPSIDRDRVEQSLAEAGEAMAYLRAATGPQTAGKGAAIRVNLNGVPNVTVSVQKLRIEGAALEPREIFDLIAFLDRAADAKSFLTAAAERFPMLAARAGGIGDFRQ
jgi:dsDNA-specific endonuclease/ATPase MutS2